MLIRTVGLVIYAVKNFAVSLSDVLRQLFAVYIFAVGGVCEKFRLCDIIDTRFRSSNTDREYRENIFSTKITSPTVSEYTRYHCLPPACCTPCCSVAELSTHQVSATLKQRPGQGNISVTTSISSLLMTGAPSSRRTAPEMLTSNTHGSGTYTGICVLY